MSSAVNLGSTSTTLATQATTNLPPALPLIKITEHFEITPGIS
jgi:hypothetical protein